MSLESKFGIKLDTGASAPSAKSLNALHGSFAVPITITPTTESWEITREEQATPARPPVGGRAGEGEAGGGGGARPK